jgi:serine/threonine protein kinase
VKNNPNFAIKQLWSPIKHGTIDNEVSTLKRLTSRNHPHIVELLGTYSYHKRLHLIFPWADGDLREFWRNFPNVNAPPRGASLASSMAEQILGIVDGLRVIHTSECQFFGHGNPNPSNVKQKYGRHGDIKPENILWFKDQAVNDPDQIVGSLKLSDFGVTSFQETGASRVDAGVARSITYQSPELDTHDQVSQSNDIWALGCVLLEFVTWYLLGHEGVENFADSRVEMYPVSDISIEVDTYYSLDVDENQPIGQKQRFVAKPKLAVLKVS